jgi:ABC-type phosphate transport system ATPase subunit
VNGERNKGRLTGIVEKSLRQAALWDEVKDRLNNSALSLSGGQAQPLCIARTLAVELVEYDRTETIFQNPRDSRTQAYVTGRMG